jgi:hypothetical protein
LAEDEPNWESWYHWSPTERRNRINHRGMLPGQWSRDRLWKSPYICLAESPSLAWGLSGAVDREKQVKSWDLWEAWLQGGDYEILESVGQTIIKEIRVYKRIYKRHLWLVGTRTV